MFKFQLSANNINTGNLPPGTTAACFPANISRSSEESALEREKNTTRGGRHQTKTSDKDIRQNPIE